LPGRFSNDVQILIQQEKFLEEEHAAYECLSYTWGSPKQPQEKIYIRQSSLATNSNTDGLQFLYVRINLMNLLRYIRMHDAARVIWIDAVCINQRDEDEKSREVARIGHIYNEAAQLLAWLELEDKSTSLAYETIKRLSVGIVLRLDHRTCEAIPKSETGVLWHCPEKIKFTPQHRTSLASFI
jgi:hypothetical protein